MVPHEIPRFLGSYLEGVECHSSPDALAACSSLGVGHCCLRMQTRQGRPEERPARVRRDSLAAASNGVRSSPAVLRCIEIGQLKILLVENATKIERVGWP